LRSFFNGKLCETALKAVFCFFEGRNLPADEEYPFERFVGERRLEE
jgi:hypothetical protein